MNRVVKEETLPSGQILQIVQGDITAEKVDAIVNAANAHLQHGGGVAAIISDRGGAIIQRESDAWVRSHGAVSHEKPAYTGAGNLPSRFVIHAVGPIWGSGDEDRKLASAVRGSLETAEELHLASLALPAISTGIFGFPKERGAGIILAAVKAYYAGRPDSTVGLTKIVLYDAPTLEAFLKAAADAG